MPYNDILGGAFMESCPPPETIAAKTLIDILTTLIDVEPNLYWTYSRLPIGNILHILLPPKK